MPLAGSQPAPILEIMTIRQPRQLLYLVFIVPLFVFLTACGSVSWQEAGDSVAMSEMAARLVRLSREQLGTPYQYGGSSPDEGFDCSGLVFYVHNRSGLYIPRSTDDQLSASTNVPLNAIRPGDLLFFRIDDDKPSHIGIYTGHGQFVHAPSSGKSVRQSRLSNPYWQKRLVRAGRFI